jgi:uncharacterized protein YcnI
MKSGFNTSVAMVAAILSAANAWAHVTLEVQEATAGSFYLATLYDDGHGKMITEGIREVVWSDGPLPDDQYDEFAMQVRLPDAPNTTVYFRVVQECAKGVNRWIEVPEPGRSPRDLKRPAPALRLKPRS